MSRALLAVIGLTLIAGSGLFAQSSVPAELLAVNVNMQVIARARPATSTQLAEWADAHGGYFVFRSFERVTLRLPADRLEALTAYLESLGDEIVSYNPSTRDLREELRNIDAAIASRRESLDKILTFVASANVTATLSFERELRSLNSELESYAGRRRMLLNDAAYAYVDVALSARERSIPVYLPSSFGWINGLGLYGFLSDLQNGGAR